MDVETCSNLHLLHVEFIDEFMLPRNINDFHFALISSGALCVILWAHELMPSHPRLGHPKTRVAVIFSRVDIGPLKLEKGERSSKNNDEQKFAGGGRLKYTVV